MQCILAELFVKIVWFWLKTLQLMRQKLKTCLLSLKVWVFQMCLIVTDAVDENLYLAARNLPHVEVIDTAAVDPVSLIGFDKVLMSVPAAKKLEVELG
jgi:large subunit ribosomal protein L4